MQTALTIAEFALKFDEPKFWTGEKAASQRVKAMAVVVTSETGREVVRGEFEVASMSVQA